MKLAGYEDITERKVKFKDELDRSSSFSFINMYILYYYL